MSYTYGDDAVDQIVVISIVPGVVDSYQLQQVAELSEEMSRMIKTAVNDTSSNVATYINKQKNWRDRRQGRITIYQSKKGNAAVAW